MIPIVTPEEMAAIDAAASEPVEELIRRAGAAVAWAVRRRLGGTYGKRVVVLHGPGNNGADGRVAGHRLRSWGVAVTEVATSVSTAELPACDLVVDAAFGTGLARPYVPPATSAPVFAVDIPSGVDGLTGELVGEPYHAVETVTFQALKPGLVLPPGAGHCGPITVADIGLDTSGATIHLVEAADVGGWMPSRPADSHKWRSACWVIGGSPGMTGAPSLAAAAAARSGAGYVRVSVPGVEAPMPLEIVQHSLAATGWERGLSTDLQRFSSVVLGPGLGRAAATADSVRHALPVIDVPLVLDGDALAALEGHEAALGTRPAATVLTPHDGEFQYLTGRRPPADRIQAVRALSAETGCIVLLKGPATIVGAPDGRVLVTTQGDQRLAAAGTGDVLSGVIGALLSIGVEPFEAAAAGAWIHGAAGRRCSTRMVASDLLAHLSEVIDATDVG